MDYNAPIMSWLLPSSSYILYIIATMKSAWPRRKRVCCSLPSAFFKSYAYSLRFRCCYCRSFQRISLLPPCGIRGCLGRARRDRHTWVAPVPLLVPEYAAVYERTGTKQLRCNSMTIRGRRVAAYMVVLSRLAALRSAPSRLCPVGTSINAFSGDCVIV